MSSIQEIYDRVLEIKAEKKDVDAIVKDALSNSKSIVDLNDEITILKEKKKGYEDSIKADLSSEIDKSDTLKADIANDEMLLSDMAISIAMKGENPIVHDKKGNECFPTFGVKFKRD